MNIEAEIKNQFEMFPPCSWNEQHGLSSHSARNMVKNIVHGSSLSYNRWGFGGRPPREKGISAHSNMRCLWHFRTEDAGACCGLLHVYHPLNCFYFLVDLHFWHPFCQWQFSSLLPFIFFLFLLFTFGLWCVSLKLLFIKIYFEVYWFFF